MTSAGLANRGPQRWQGPLLIGLVGGLVAICLLRYAIDREPGGSISLAWPESAWSTFRRHAIIAGVIVGGGLGVAGAILQSLLRNPLASPYLLGISSGAGLGVMVAMAIAASAGLVSAAQVDWSLPAVIGALVALVAVLALGRRERWPDPVTVLLAGVVVATICAGGMMLLQHLVPMDIRGRFLTWMMGTLPELISPWQLALTGIVIVLGFAVSWMMHRGLDLSLLGDDEARSLGVRIERVRLVLLIVAGTLTAATVALAGPIGFVGLIAPHVARRLVGAHHAWLLPASFLVGSILIVAADAGRQLIDLGTGRLPIGVLTILVGGPVFLWLLRREIRVDEG